MTTFWIIFTTNFLFWLFLSCLVLALRERKKSAGKRVGACKLHTWEYGSDINGRGEFRCIKCKFHTGYEPRASF